MATALTNLVTPFSAAAFSTLSTWPYTSPFNVIDLPSPEIDTGQKARIVRQEYDALIQWPFKYSTHSGNLFVDSARDVLKKARERGIDTTGISIRAVESKDTARRRIFPQDATETATANLPPRIESKSGQTGGMATRQRPSTGTDINTLSPSPVGVIARLLREDRKDRQMLQVFERKIAEAQTIESDLPRAYALKVLASSIAAAGLIELAESAFRDAAGIVRNTGNNDNHGVKALCDIAVSASAAGFEDLALTVLSEAGDAVRKTADHRTSVLKWCTIALSFMAVGSKSLARESFTGALGAASKIEDGVLRVRTLRDIAVLLARGGNKGRAAETFRMAAEVAWEMEPLADNTAPASVLCELAFSAAEAGFEELAAGMFDFAIAGVRNLGDDSVRLTLLKMLGDTLFSANMAGREETVFDKLHSVARDLTDETARFEALSHLASLTAEKDKIRAKGAFDEAAMYARQMGDFGSAERARALTVLAVSLAQAGFKEDAAQFFFEAATAASAVRNAAVRAEILNEFDRTVHELFDADQADIIYNMILLA